MEKEIGKNVISFSNIPINCMLPPFKAKKHKWKYTTTDLFFVFFPTKSPPKVHNIFNEVNCLCSLGTIDWTRQTWMCLMWMKAKCFGLGNISAQQRHTERKRQWNPDYILNDVEHPILESIGLESTVTDCTAPQPHLLVIFIATNSHYQRQSATDYSLQS